MCLDHIDIRSGCIDLLLLHHTNEQNIANFSYKLPLPVLYLRQRHIQKKAILAIQAIMLYDPVHVGRKFRYTRAILISKILRGLSYPRFFQRSWLSGSQRSCCHISQAYSTASIQCWYRVHRWSYAWCWCFNSQSSSILTVCLCAWIAAFDEQILEHEIYFAHLGRK